MKQQLSDASTAIKTQNEILIKVQRETAQACSSALVTSTAAATASAVYTAGSEASTAVAVQRQVKSNCGLIPVVKASNNKSPFNIRSCSFFQNLHLVNIFVDYIISTV